MNVDISQAHLQAGGLGAVPPQEEVKEGRKVKLSSRGKRRNRHYHHHLKLFYLDRCEQLREEGLGPCQAHYQALKDLEWVRAEYCRRRHDWHSGRHSPSEDV